MLAYLFTILTLLSFSGEKSIKFKGDNAKIEIRLAGNLKIAPVKGKTLTISYTIPDSLTRYFSIEKENNKVRIAFTDSFKIKNLKHLKELRDTLEFRIEMPEEVILDLEVGGGLLRNEMELGGLKLKSFTLEYGAGTAHVKFSKPNNIVMEQFEVSAGASKIEIYKLGNANFTKGEINCGVSSVTIDLGGKWKEKAALYISSGLASINLKAPRGLAFNVIKEGVLNPGLGEIKTKNPKFTIYFEGAINALNYEVYEK